MQIWLIEQIGRIKKQMMFVIEGNKKKKANLPNSVRGTHGFTKPSRKNGTANVQINSETAVPILKKLGQNFKGVVNQHGFLTDLRNALYRFVDV